MERISKENYYLDIAETVLERATCLRRVYGAIIVKNDEIISTGYNGAPRGRANCVDMGYCSREAMKVPRGERYELCRSVLLPYVPPHDHQCGSGPGGDPPDGNGIRGGPRGGVDRGG